MAIPALSRDAGKILPLESSLGFGQKLKVSKPGRGSSGARRLAGIAGLLEIGLRYMFYGHMNRRRNLLNNRTYMPLLPFNVIDMSSVAPKRAAQRHSGRRSAHGCRLLKVLSSRDSLALDQQSMGGHR
jgi:hypothetical protein